MLQYINIAISTNIEKYNITTHENYLKELSSLLLNETLAVTNQYLSTIKENKEIIQNHIPNDMDRLTFIDNRIYIKELIRKIQSYYNISSLIKKIDPKLIEPFAIHALNSVQH